MNVRVTLTGETPLIVHAQRGLNRQDPLAREYAQLSKKRGKTDDDKDRLSDLEFTLGLYVDGKGHPVIPAFNVKRCLQDGARMSKRGKDISRALRPLALEYRILYKGPATLVELLKDHTFRDVRMVKVSGMVERTRPIFRAWALDADFFMDDEMMDLDTLQYVSDKAGSYVALGDFRVDCNGDYGRFKAVVTQIS